MGWSVGWWVVGGVVGGSVRWLIRVVGGDPGDPIPGLLHCVWVQLHSGKAVGIFPEGGSHDRPSLLPLKAGVAVMALGALAKHPNLPLRLVPVGLNYFSGHRFRSRVFVDIGEPLHVPPHLLPKYCSADVSQRREATDELIQMVPLTLAQTPALTLTRRTTNDCGWSYTHRVRRSRCALPIA